MFKRFITIATSLILGLCVGAVFPVFAAEGDVPLSEAARDPDTLRVYYSESLGAGQEVYRLTACEKALAYAPLTCSKELLDAPGGGIYRAQCLDSKQKVIEGQNIKGCKNEDTPNLDGTSYYDVSGDIAEYDKTKAQGGCSDVAENHYFVYGSKYAVLEVESGEEGGADNPNNIVGSIVWKVSELPPDSLVLRQFGDCDSEGKNCTATKGYELLVAPSYEISQCYSVDHLPDAPAGDAPQGPEAAVQAIKKLNSEFDDLMTAGCNNDNTSRPLTNEKGEIAIPRATSLNPDETLSCTIAERIDGKSGTDLLARYVGAIYRWAAGIIGIISVLIIVISGIQMSIAGGDQGMVDKAKERISQSLMGLVLLFLSALILYTINPTFYTG